MISAVPFFIAVFESDGEERGVGCLFHPLQGLLGALAGALCTGIFATFGLIFRFL